MFTLSPKALQSEIIACFEAGLTPMVTSSPGVGKSSIFHEIAAQHNLKVIDLRLSQCTPEDLQGYPMRSGNKATFTPFDVFPLEGEDVPDGYAGWLLFLDELTSATKPVQAAAYKLILDRMVGSFKLHPNVAIGAAGNKASDKAVVNQMSTALQSRLIHFEMEASLDDWLDYANRTGIDARVRGFISYMPSKLMDFRPDHQDKTFPCPRTWEFASRLIQGKDVTPAMGARLAGTVGHGAAVEFITFAQEFHRLPKLNDILLRPSSTTIPDESSTKFAVITMLIDNADPTNVSSIIEYTSRLPIELQIIFARGVVSRFPKMASQSQAFAKYLPKMARYLQ